MITIIVPIYNVSEFLERCLCSLEIQTFNDFEVLMVDDGSKDNSAAIAAKYTMKDKRFKLFRKENGGLSDARNFGIERAKGDFITFVDSDDYVSPLFLEKLYRSLMLNQADIAICNFKIFLYGQMVETSDFQNAQIFNMSNQDAILNMNKSPNSTAYVTAWGKLYKKTIFDSIRFPKGKFHEDEFTTYKTFYVSQRITFIDYPLYYYFFRQNSIMNSENYQKKVDLFEALIGRSTFFENNKILFNSSIERCFYAYINIRTHLKCAYKRKLKPLINEFFNLEHSNNISKKNKKEFLIWKYFAFLGIINYYFNRLIIRSKDFFRKG